jgi:hypothetical protein
MPLDSVVAPVRRCQSRRSRYLDQALNRVFNRLKAKSIVSSEIRRTNSFIDLSNCVKRMC